MPTGGFSSHYELGALAPLLEQGQLLLTPNQRLARTVKTAWDARQVALGLRVWRPATVRALDGWLQQCWEEAVASGRCPPRVRLNPLQERELWAQVIAEDGNEHGGYNLLQPGGAAELAATARDSLLQAGIDTRAAAVEQLFRLDADCGTFLRWLRAFDTVLASRGLATRADCLRELLAVEAPAIVDSVALLDCNDLTQLQQACLESLAGTVVHVSALGEEAPFLASSWPDRAAELAAVARWAAQTHAQDPQCRLGIILGDMQGDRETLEYLLRREFDCLGDNYTALPVNFSTGISLDRAPVVRDALRMLACCDREIACADILGLLVSRFTPGTFGLDDGGVALVQQLFADGRETVETGRLRGLAARGSEAGDADSLGGKLNAIHALRLQRARKLPSAWAEDIHPVLGIWGWPGSGALDSLEYQQVVDWYQVLEDFAACDRVAGEIELGAALALLRRCCQSSISQPQTADTGVQVLGTLEAAGLQFDSIWLCGLEASRWPAPLRPNPFIPMRLQREHAMPHASSEYEWRYAAGLLGQYRAGCRQFIASYARQSDGAPELPSPLLHGHPVDAMEETAGVPRQWTQQLHAAQVDSLDDSIAPTLAGGGHSGGSALLQDQASCPFRAFARHRLGAQVLDAPHAGLSARERGDLLHNAMYALWGGIGDSAALAAMDDDACTRALQLAVDAALEAVPEPLRLLVGAHCLDLERQRLCTLLAQWLELERNRPPFRVSVREAPREFQLGELTLRLRVDRVDSLDAGGQLVIDYKSGLCKPAHWLGERPKEPQLPLYALATGAVAVAFAQVRARDCQLLGLGEPVGIPGVADDMARATSRYQPAEDWQELQAQWQHNLETLAAEFIGGEARVDPQPGACQYCGLQALCRVDLVEDEA